MLYDTVINLQISMGMKIDIRYTSIDGTQIQMHIEYVTKPLYHPNFVIVVNKLHR